MSSYDFIAVSSAWELTLVSMRYSKREEVNTSLSRITYCTPVQVSFIYAGISKADEFGIPPRGQESPLGEELE